MQQKRWPLSRTGMVLLTCFLAARFTIKGIVPVSFQSTHDDQHGHARNVSLLVDSETNEPHSLENGTLNLNGDREGRRWAAADNASMLLPHRPAQDNPGDLIPATEVGSTILGSSTESNKLSPRLQTQVKSGASTIATTALFGAPEYIGPSTSSGVVSIWDSAYKATEGAGSVTMILTRSGTLAAAMSVAYTTEDGEGEHAAKAATKDYVAKQGTLDFLAGVSSAQLTIEVLDDDELEPDEHFFVKLLGVSKGAAEVMGEQSRGKVTIINDDFPGVPHPHRPEFRGRDLTSKESRGRMLGEQLRPLEPHDLPPRTARQLHLVR